MHILQVIHGYPPHYMAGSEVYTRNLCRELARNHRVSVFSRCENPFVQPYQEAVSFEDGIEVVRINKPLRDYTLKDKYLDPRMDSAFRATLRRLKPDIVHIGHLSHLSTQIPAIAKREFGIPTIFTVHDFWLHCFRGQLVRQDLSCCDGPSDVACTACARDILKDTITAQDLPEMRAHMRNVMAHVDLFLAPSRTVERFLVGQGIPARKVRFSPYGLDVSRIRVREPRARTGDIRFGFMGRVIPVKGVGPLLRAFSRAQGNATLNVWGAVAGQLPWLRELCANDERVRFHGSYANDAVHEVLETFDVLVAPSLWLENAPLVIQEAMAAEMPVVTTNAGGMAELIHDGANGFLVPMGDENRLTEVLQRIINVPEALDGLRGDRSAVRTIEDDAHRCVETYKGLLPTKRLTVLDERPAPWRVTFVTNPGTCNLKCAMCDTHSPHAPKRTKPLPYLDIEHVERTVRELAPRGLREVIPSTMGEPLMYKDFNRLLALAADSRVKVNLTTNGTFPLGGVERWAPALLPVVSDVKFSVNAVSQRVATAVMEGLDVEAQLNGIRMYLQARDEHALKSGNRSTVSFQCTLQESNLEEMPAILRWAIRHGVDRLKTHHLWVTWPQLRGQSLRRTAVAAERWNQMSAVLAQIAAEERLPGGQSIRLENAGPLSTDAPDQPEPDSVCPFLGQEAWVEADGSFQVCCCPSTKRAAFGDFGSVKGSAFMELWNSEAYRGFVASWGNHPNCQECNMRRPRNGGAA